MAKKKEMTKEIEEKKEAKNKKRQVQLNLFEEIEEEPTTEESTEQKEKGEEKDTNKVWKVIRMILLIITSPVWFPWKVLFVRKPGNKFSEVSTGKKIFRIVRSPITKTLKLAVFLCIIGLEVLLVYKARYSVLTYNFTKNSVQDYYLSSKGDVNEEYTESLKQAFDHIDDWDLDSKNKMYVVFDSDIMKTTIDAMPEDTTKHFLDRFNDDEDFREDIKDVAKNINGTLSRAVKELPETIDSDELNAILKPITTAGSAVVDYRAILDAAGSLATTAMKDTDMDLTKVDLKPNELDASLAMIINYSQGMSLEEAYFKANEHYKG